MSISKSTLDQHLGIVDRVRVEHDAYADILEEIGAAFRAVGTSASPVGLLVTGESRTGKSSVVRDFLEGHLPRQQDNQVIRNVVYAVVPAKASVKSLLESLLRGLGDPLWSRGTESNMTHRLFTQLDAVQCRMIILDEFQHLCDKGQKKQLDLLADWIKVLMESRQYGVIAVGLPIAASVVNTHPQLRNRFDDGLRLPLFDWQDTASVSQFRGILLQFERQLAPFELPALTGQEMAFRMYLASAGRIGLIAKLLDRAVADAIRNSTLVIDLPALARAYARAIWSASRFPVEGGPFGAEIEKLALGIVREQVLAMAKMEQVADTSAEVTVFGNASPNESATTKGKRTSDDRKRKPSRVTKRKLREELERAL